MTSMVMLGITMEVSKNKSLPIKGKTQTKPGHSWSFLGIFGNSCTLFGILDILALALEKLFSFGLRAKFS